MPAWRARSGSRKVWPTFSGSPVTDETQAPVLTFEGKRYDLNSLPDDIKELVRGMQVADAQLRMHEDTLKVLAVGRQSMAMQLNERLQSIPPLGDG
jgi:hypothetical protein